MQIIYEKHPVSVERKRELNAKGFRIIDIEFAPKDYAQEAQKPVELPQEKKQRKGRAHYVVNDR